jgi:hypothetical protein
MNVCTCITFGGVRVDTATHTTQPHHLYRRWHACTRVSPTFHPAVKLARIVSAFYHHRLTPPPPPPPLLLLTGMETASSTVAPWPLTRRRRRTSMSFSIKSRHN